MRIVRGAVCFLLLLLMQTPLATASERTVCKGVVIIGRDDEYTAFTDLIATPSAVYVAGQQGASYLSPVAKTVEISSRR